MKRYFLLLFSFFALLPTATFADSPLTSTGFAQAYKDVPIVEYALATQQLDAKLLKYLKKKGKPIDVKAAIVNALGWNFDGTSYAAEYRSFLAKRYKTTSENLNLDKMRGDELMVLGYFTALGDYFNPAPAVPILKKAQSKMPKSFTVNMMLALAEAQVAFDQSWCEVYKIPKKVEDNVALKQDLRPEAVKIIMEYIGLYQSEC